MVLLARLVRMAFSFLFSFSFSCSFNWHLGYRYHNFNIDFCTSLKEKDSGWLFLPLGILNISSGNSSNRRHFDLELQDVFILYILCEVWILFSWGHFYRKVDHKYPGVAMLLMAVFFQWLLWRLYLEETNCNVLAD